MRGDAYGRSMDAPSNCADGEHCAPRIARYGSAMTNDIVNITSKCDRQEAGTQLHRCNEATRNGVNDEQMCMPSNCADSNHSALQATERGNEAAKNETKHSSNVLIKTVTCVCRELLLAGHVHYDADFSVLMGRSTCRGCELTLRRC